MADLRSVTTCCLGVVNEATLYMLKTLQKLAAPLDQEAIYLTAGTNGEHSGPDDPHYRGDALDLRTHNFPTRAAKFAFCDALQAALGKSFYACVEDPDQPNEHIHVQVKKGCVYPPTAISVGAARTT